MPEINTYNCLIIDDEPLARQLIQTHIDNIPELNVIKQCSSAIEAKQYLETNTIDLMFLDIQMPDLSGIDLLKTLQNPPKTILTTAYSEFALEGYELNVIDYLLKPVIFERFYKATLKAIEILQLERNNNLPTTELDNQNILIKSKHQLNKVKLIDGNKLVIQDYNVPIGKNNKAELISKLGKKI